MWTVIVELRLEGGVGTIFQVGKWHNENSAAQFARELEWKLGENIVTASVGYSNNYVQSWLTKLTRSHVRVRPNRRITGFQLPPCDFEDD